MQKPIATELQELRDERALVAGKLADTEAARVSAESAAAEQRAARAADLEAAGALVASLEGEIAKLKEELALAMAVATAANARADEAERKLALVPAAGDVSAGAKPVADGGAGGSVTDWVAEVERRTGADRMAFYRANQAAIDAAYNARNGR